MHEPPHFIDVRQVYGLSEGCCVHVDGEEGSSICWAGRKVPNPGSSHPRPSLYRRLADYAGTSVPETMAEELE